MRSFRRDESAGIGLDITLLTLAIVVPLALFVLLFRYLRHTAPGGIVAPSTAPAPLPDSDTAKIAGAKKCKRCGVDVRPAAGRIYVKECPNCGSGLGG
jgi:hypothetical protein